MKAVSALSLALFLALIPSITIGQTVGYGDQRWLDGLALVALDEEGPQAVHRARRQIQEQGGVVGIMSTSGVILGWIPPAATESLAGQAGIHSVHHDAVDLPSLGFAAQKTGSKAEYFVSFFNAAVTGTLPQAPRTSSNMKWDPPLGGDSLPPEPVDTAAYLANLERQGYSREDLESLDVLDLSKAPNNDTMSGTVLASLFIVESDGTGIYPNDHDFSEQDTQDIVNGRIGGLLWWSASAPSYGCWVAFLMEVYPPTDPRCQAPQEPVGTGQVGTIMSNVMGNFGYFGGAYSANTSFNTAQRLANGADRAFSMITTWPGGRAWAYRFGPYTWLPYPPPAPDTTAHEVGHIFGACDEYAEACAACTGGGECSANGVGNPNCENCPGSGACIMKASTFVLCQATDDHVGWGFSPCAPAPLPNPTITSISPSTGEAGETIQVTITGTNLLQSAQLDLGPNVEVYELSYSGTSITADIIIDTIAAPGPRDAVLTNPDLSEATITSGFAILATPNHYYAQGGGNVFPYTSAATAATTLQSAIDAAGPGDTVNLEAGLLSSINIKFSRAVTISGGWDSGFVSQDLVAKTQMDLSPNLRSTADIGFDNMRFVNGDGRVEVLPVPGKYGGAVQVIDANLTLINCEFQTNAAQDLQDVGYGGAVYVLGGTVNITATLFDDNAAFLGGALYLENCDGTIDANTFTSNRIDVGGVDPLLGGAVYMLNCSNVVLQDNTFDSNSGAASGGAIYIAGGSGSEVRGGSLSNHSASTQGGAVVVDGGDLLVEDVLFDANTATTLGGALTALNGAAVTVRRSQFLGNTAQLGGAMYIPGGEAYVEHNLMLQNEAPVTGAAIFLSGLSAGRVLGNTLDGNVVGATGADLLVASSSIDVKNNIVANSTGTAVSCGVANVDFNLVYNAAVNAYDGCTPGPGSVSADPLFVDPVGGDFHLALNSPAIDSGDSDAALNDPDGSRGDLGSYGSHTFAMDQPVFPANLTGQLDAGDALLQWDANTEPDLANYAVYSGATAGFTPSAATFETLVPAGTTTVNLGPLGGTRYYRISAVDSDGYASGYSAEASIGGATGTELPTSHQWVLHQNIPNPFNPRTTISFELREQAPVKLVIFDVTGRLVTTLVDGMKPSGPHSVVWNATGDDGTRVASGIYYYKLVAGSFVATNKLVVLK